MTVPTSPLCITFAALAWMAAAPVDAGQPGPPVESRAGQPAAREAAPPPPVVHAVDENAEQTRERLSRILEQYPPSVAEVLRLDPSLLGSQTYLVSYPALATFLAQHPEVAHNPSFFIGDARTRPWRPSDPRVEAIHAWRNMFDGLVIFGVFVVVTGVLVWLVRTLIDYRRWLRVSRVQVEVHSKLLDRFTANEDLLAYVQTPAGRKFLESSPVPLDAGPRAISAPIGRILWSVQAGIVLACGGLGLQWVSGRVTPDVSEPLFTMGTLGLALGVGFALSAGMAYVLSRRLGLFDRPAAGAGGAGGLGVTDAAS